MRPRWRDTKGRIYEWDKRHGTVEVYDKTGKRHRGEFDPVSGKRLGPADPPKAGRTMKSTSEESLMSGFVLQGFDRATDELRIELPLPPVPIDRLRALFDVRDDPDVCDAYPLDAAKVQALAPLVGEPIDIERYDFFLQRYL